MRSAVLLLAMLAMVGAVRAQDGMPLQPETDSDEAGLWMQVARLESDLKSSSTLVQDKRLTDHVQGVACAVAGPACAALRIYVIASPVFNISSLPNGAIIVPTGLLLRATNDAQLAHLLGHEIAHYRHKDSLGQFHRMLNTSSAAALLGVAAAGIGLNFVGTAASTAALNIDYAHSQSEEREADAAGFESAIASGHDPQAGVTVWRDLALEQAAARRANRDVFAALHPQPDDRLAVLQAMADSAPKRAFWKTGAETYRVLITPFLERWVAEELRRGEPAQSIVLFTRLSQQDPARGLYRYALGEAHRKRGLPGDGALAQSAFRAAIAASDAPPLAWRGLGLMAMQDGDRKSAREAFAHYRAALPGADDRAMIDDYLAQL